MNLFKSGYTTILQADLDSVFLSWQATQTIAASMLSTTIACIFLVLIPVKSSSEVFNKTLLDDAAPCSNESLPCSNKHPDSCPPGLFCVDGHCKCGVYPENTIACNGTDSFTFAYYCVTFDEEREVISMGACVRRMNHTKPNGAIGVDTLYHELPRDVHFLDTLMCGPLKRTGRLCGRCLPDHYPMAYSFNMTCIRCPNVHWNWVRYIMAAYIPLTLFYLIIFFFKINTTSSYLFPVVFYCQTLSLPMNLRNILRAIASYMNHSYILVSKLGFSLYGIWNLDFFRPFYSDLCLGTNTLPTLALDYLIAVYPLLLIILSHLLITLNGRNYRVITLILSPFRVLLSLFRRNWDVRTSVIDTFATFFFLSYVKLLSVSFDLLAPIKIYELYPDHFNHTYGLYYAPSMEYFGQEHLPYAVLAIFVLCGFCILPVTVLALYPFPFFQRFLNFFPIRWHILHTFVDSYYGCYKDGTQPGTRDCRWCASIFFIIRFLQLILFYIRSKEMYNVVITLGLIFVTTLFSTLHPFKPSLLFYNAANIIFLQLLTFLCVSIIGLSLKVWLSHVMLNFFYGLGVVITLVPILYFIAGLLYWIYKHNRCDVSILHRLRERFNYAALPGEVIDGESLPDRIGNPGGYHSRNLANFTSQTKHDV